MPKDHDLFDVAVAGGGLAGALCALALERQGVTVALVDAQTFDVALAPTFDGRTSAIAFAAIRLFRRLGLWDRIGDQAEPILDILVSDGRRETRTRRGGTSRFFLHFDSRELATGEPLGAIVENRVLRAALASAIDERPNIRVIAPKEVVGADFADPAATLHFSDGGSIAARLVVAADGKRSRLRRAAGIGAHEWSYRQAGIVATVEHDRPHHGLAQELFLVEGPFAILPMTASPEGAPRSSLVWTEREAAAPAYLALPPGAFDDAVRRRFGDYLGAVRATGPRWSYPLAFHFSRRFIAPRMALLGDAARAIHPIAGQGFNLGIKDVAALADAVAESRALGLDIGGGAVLEAYERWRRFDSAALAFGTDALNRLFSSDFPPLRLARSLGLSAAGALAPARTFFMRQAGADLGRLPALMQPFG